jgi:isovaleryl-CoA dehydrogenase
MTIAPEDLPEPRGAIAAPNFELGDEHNRLLDEITRNARSRFAHDAMQRDLDGCWPADGFSRLAKMGVLGASVPQQYGGAGMDLFSAGLVGQAIGRVDPSVSTSWQSHDNLCVNNLYQNGNEFQRRKYLPSLTDGSHVGAIGMTEPNAGSDALGGMAMTAVRDGDAYLLNGSKTYITNGPIADVVLVYAKTAPALGKKGISAFIVERTFGGFSSSLPFDKMGIRASPTGALYFDDCRVPVENLVGEENKGVAVMMSGLDIERAFCSMMVLGMSERAVELSVEYAKSRQQFGQRIGDFQMIQSKLAEMYVAIETMRGLVYRALAKANAVGAGEGGRGEIHKLSAAAFMYAGEACMRICDEAVQIHGGNGFMRETEVNQLYRSAKIQEIGGGTKEIRRLIIAREMLAE